MNCRESAALACRKRLRLSERKQPTNQLTFECQHRSFGSASIYQMKFPREPKMAQTPIFDRDIRRNLELVPGNTGECWRFGKVPFKCIEVYNFRSRRRAYVHIFLFSLSLPLSYSLSNTHTNTLSICPYFSLGQPVAISTSYLTRDKWMLSSGRGKGWRMSRRKQSKIEKFVPGRDMQSVHLNDSGKNSNRSSGFNIVSATPKRLNKQIRFIILIFNYKL